MKLMYSLIFVNNMCDKGCPDCYYPKGGTKMTDETIDKVTTWLANSYRDHGVKEFKIQFLGGEPLNTFDVVEKLHDQLMQKKPEETQQNFEGGFVMFTNGDAITQEILEKAKEWKMRFMLNPTHDPLNIVEEKLRRIKSVCGWAGTSICLDEYNLERLPDLSRTIIKAGGQIRAQRLFDGALREGYVEKLEIQLHKMLDIVMEAEPPMWPNWLFENLYPLWKDTTRNPCVSCGKYLFTIEWDGTLRSCQPKYDSIMGHIDTHKFEDLVWHQKWTAEGLDDCQSCEWKLWCQGGCPYTRYLSYGTYLHKSPYCQVFKSIFPKLMKIKDRWVEAYYQGKTYRRDMTTIPIRGAN